MKRLAKFLGRSPDTATAVDLRAFQKHLVEVGASSSTINATIRGLRFLFETTLERPQVIKRMSAVRVPDRLPVVLSTEDVARLLNASPNLKAKAALSVAYGAGLRATDALGGHRLRCNQFDTDRIAYNSRRNRHCPKCQGLEAEQWLEDRQAELTTFGNNLR